MKERVVFISEHGNSAPVAWRLMAKGVPCNLYVHENAYRPIYSNMIPRLNVGALPACIEQASHVVIDMVRPNNQTPEDHALLGQFGLDKPTLGVFGALGDKIRKTYPDKTVVGGGTFSERVELNREEGIDLARRVGLKIPEYHKFTSLKDAAKFVHSGSGKSKKWVIKPNGNAALDLTYAETFKNGGEILDLLTTVYPARFGTDKVDIILQAFIEDAAEISSALWFYKGKIVSANRTFENKKLIEGDKGPNMGSASNTVWQCKNWNGVVHKQMQGLIPFIGDLCGESDANCMIDRHGDAWFLEWTFMRYGLDALYNQLQQMKNMEDFWLRDFQVKYKPGFAASQRLTLWPAPRVKTESDRKEIRGNLINHDLKDLDNWWLQDVKMDDQGRLRVAGADGLVGVVSYTSRDMEDAINACQKACEEFEVTGNKQWRTDHLAKHMERRKKLMKWHINIF